MNSSNNIGFNNENFNEMVLSIYNVKEELNTTFNNLNSSIDRLEKYYKTDSSKKIIEQYRIFADSNYNTIIDNFDSYITDLKMAKENIESFDNKLLERLLEEEKTIKS